MRSAKADTNQPEIVAALRQVGAFVSHTHQVGNGFPDIVVLFRDTVHLIEIKTPGGRLTKAEREWHATWGGCDYVHIVFDAEQALEAIGATVVGKSLREKA